MSQHPLPVIICSSFAEKGSDVFNKALEYGAADIMQKPDLSTPERIEEATVLICDAVKAAALIKPENLIKHKRTKAKKLHEKYNTADVILKPVTLKAPINTTEKIIVIGASTGGTQAITTLLSVLPKNSPGIVIVQHMPKGFTHSFAQRLNTLCKLKVKEAEHGDLVERGLVLIAPGDKHLLCKRSANKYYVELKDGPLVSRHRPSVDVLFRSVAMYAGNNAVGVILTGMGKDGSQGMKEMHDVGCKTIAQDEESSIVFGMPKEAIQLGGADHICPLDNIAQKMLSLCSEKSR